MKHVVSFVFETHAGHTKVIFYDKSRTVSVSDHLKGEH